MKKLKYLIAAAGITGLLLTTPIGCSDYTKIEYQKAQETITVQETVTEITTLQQLEDMIAKNEKVAVDIGATWCGPCKYYAPIFEEVAKEYQGKVVFFKVVLDKIDDKEERKISDKYLIRYIPKTIFFKDGKEVHNRVGGIEKEDLTELIETYLLEKK
ncbi:MAG: thioredoxin domain-containing protein [Nanoarchaeota archaeon]|nr:thioredoxin domain-containing protein [Nanoarchaeota archaeon]